MSSSSFQEWGASWTDPSGNTWCLGADYAPKGCVGFGFTPYFLSADCTGDAHLQTGTEPAFVGVVIGREDGSNWVYTGPTAPVWIDQVTSSRRSDGSCNSYPYSGAIVPADEVVDVGAPPVPTWTAPLRPGFL